MRYELSQVFYLEDQQGGIITQRFEWFLFTDTVLKSISTKAIKISEAIFLSAIVPVTVK
jgi:hypothetical protein